MPAPKQSPEIPLESSPNVVQSLIEQTNMTPKGALIIVVLTLIFGGGGGVIAPRAIGQITGQSPQPATVESIPNKELEDYKLTQDNFHKDDNARRDNQLLKIEEKLDKLAEKSATKEDVRNFSEQNARLVEATGKQVEILINLQKR